MLNVFLTLSRNARFAWGFSPAGPSSVGCFLAASAVVSWVNQTQPSSELPISGVTARHSSHGTEQSGLCCGHWPWGSSMFLLQFSMPGWSCITHCSRAASPAQIPIAEVCLGLSGEVFSPSPACLAPAAYSCGFTRGLFFKFYSSIELLRLSSCINVLGEAYIWPLTSYSYGFGAQEIGSWVHLLWDIYPEIFTPFLKNEDNMYLNSKNIYVLWSSISTSGNLLEEFIQKKGKSFVQKDVHNYFWL